MPAPSRAEREPYPPPQAAIRARPALAWAAVVAAGTALPLAVVLASGRTLSYRDTVHLFEPVRPLVVAALREFRLPLWNPYEALGIPLFAQPQHGVLHPVSILTAFLAPSAGMDPLIVAHVLLAALGAFVLARELDASHPAAAVGGLGYGLSGYVLGMSCNLPFLAAAGAAPWAVAALRAAGSGTPLAAAVAALAAGVQLLAGDPQWGIVAVALGLALATERGGSRGLRWATLAAALGGALAAVQYLPTWAFLEQTSRTAGLNAAERAQWALAPWRILEFVVPGFFWGRPGSGAGAVFLRLGGTAGYPAPFVPSVHLGVVVLALAAMGARSSRPAKVLAGAAVVVLWLALGVHLGADQLLRWVPVWGSFRYSEKLVGPLTLCVAMLAALGVDRVGSMDLRRARSIAVGVAAIALLGPLVVALGGEGLLRGWLDDAAAVGRERLLVGLVHLVVGIALATAAVFAMKRPSVRRHAAALAGALVVLQGAGASGFALHAGVRGVRDPDPLRRARAPGEVTRIATPTRKGLVRGPPALDGLDQGTFLESRMGVAPYAVPAGIDHVTTYSPLWPLRYERVFFALFRDFREARWVAWRRFALNRVVVDRITTTEGRAEGAAAIAGGRAVHVDEAVGFSAWEVPHRSWAAFAEGIVPVSSERDAYLRLADSIAAEARDVVVEEPPLPLAAAPGRVLAFERGAERVRVEGESTGDGTLVVNDAWWPGWKATIDGRSTPILRADVLVRAVPWPAGRHVLEMRYEPSEVRLGFSVTAAAALAIAVLAVVGWRVRRA